MPFCARPSMVVTLVPTAPLTGNEHERVATPSTCTVQAPHCAMPQPYLVPVRPTFSRITQSSGVSGSTSTLNDFPLIVRFAIAVPLLVQSTDWARAELEWQNGRVQIKIFCACGLKISGMHKQQEDIGRSGVSRVPDNY